MMPQHEFSREELLIGKEGLQKLKNSKVVIFGVGGVGSYTVEALTRSGIGKLILVDNDDICITNLNRQIHALHSTISQSKVEVMKTRIRDINKECDVKIYKTFMNEDNIDEMIDEDTDYIIDAIDTVSSKIALALWCQNHNIKIISCMGTGNKFDPTMFKIADIYDTKMCPLAKVMRHELKKRGVKSLKVLYSDEMPVKPKQYTLTNNQNTICCENKDTNKYIRKKQVAGTLSFVPPVAGMIIAGEVIKDLLGYNEKVK